APAAAWARGDFRTTEPRTLSTAPGSRSGPDPLAAHLSQDCVNDCRVFPALCSRGLGGTTLEVAGARTLGRGDVPGVGQGAPAQRQAAAADARRELVPKVLQGLDLVVDPGPPGAGEALPVGL